MLESRGTSSACGLTPAAFSLLSDPYKPVPTFDIQHLHAQQTPVGCMLQNIRFSSLRAQMTICAHLDKADGHLRVRRQGLLTGLALSKSTYQGRATGRPTTDLGTMNDCWRWSKFRIVLGPAFADTTCDHSFIRAHICS